MGGGTIFQILGALETVAIVSILFAVGFANRHKRTRMFIGLSIAVSTLALCVYVSSRSPTLKDWVYLPLTEFFHLIRFGS
jgi:hypothetical protein